MRFVPMLLGLASCALTSNAPPREVRHFTPEVAVAPAPAVQSPRCGRLALGRVSASAHLRYQIVHRSSNVEVGMFETLRWTERPEVYVERALSRYLFDIGGLVQTIDRGPLSLEVNVLAFEQIDARPPRARVQLEFSLRADRAIIRSGTVTAERPSRSANIEGVVIAIGQATDSAAAELAARVIPAAREHDGCAPAG